MEIIITIEGLDLPKSKPMRKFLKWSIGAGLVSLISIIITTIAFIGLLFYLHFHLDSAIKEAWYGRESNFIIQYEQQIETKEIDI